MQLELLMIYASSEDWSDAAFWRNLDVEPGQPKAFLIAKYESYNSAIAYGWLPELYTARPKHRPSRKNITDVQEWEGTIKVTNQHHKDLTPWFQFVNDPIPQMVEAML